MLREMLEDHRRRLKHIETTLWDHSERLQKLEQKVVGLGVLQKAARKSARSGPKSD